MDALAGIPPALLVIAAFVFGASVGSFLNVVIARVPFGQSIVWPPSHCMACGTPIRPFHNVPILSWFLLRGRCGTCLAPFSIRYAAIEALFAVVCALAVLRHGPTLPAAREMVMMGLLIPLTFMDLDWWILPTQITKGGIVAGLLLALAEGWETFLHRLFAAALGYTSLVVIAFIGERIFKKEAMGQGDTWLLAMIGAFIGARALLPVYLLSSVQGVAVGIPMILLRRKKEAAAGPEQHAEAPATPAASEPTAAPEAAPPAAPEPPAPVPASQDEEEWVPDPNSIPFGPFLSLAAAEILYFSHLPDLLFPWPF